MSASLVFSKIVAQLFLFPGNFLLVLLLCLCLPGTRWRTWGRGLILCCVAVVAVLSMPVVAQRLIASVETVPAIPAGELPLVASAAAGASGGTSDAVSGQAEPTARPRLTGRLQGAQAIVVISGDILYHQAEYGGNSAGPSTLERIRYAAYLYRRTGLPILVSGGVPVGGESSAEVMRRELTGFFQVPVRWVEGQSQNTAQNARDSWNILHKQGMDTVILVTSASHMPRAQASFLRAGFKVIAAPTGFHTPPMMGVLDYVPQMTALGLSNTALHEWIGRWWYDLRGE